MINETEDNDPFNYKKPSSAPQSKRETARKKKREKESSSFWDQDVNLNSSAFFPDGFENIMLAIYFIIIPYIVGLIFIFFYIGKGDYEVFLSLDTDNSFMITWAIGYEVTASLFLLWIIKQAIFSIFHEHKRDTKFKIP